MKLVVAADSRRVLGVHIVGHGAAEMIQLAAVALGMGATKEDFDRTMRGASDRRPRSWSRCAPGAAAS